MVLLSTVGWRAVCLHWPCHARGAVLQVRWPGGCRCIVRAVQVQYRTVQVLRGLSSRCPGLEARSIIDSSIIKQVQQGTYLVEYAYEYAYTYDTIEESIRTGTERVLNTAINNDARHHQHSATVILSKNANAKSSTSSIKTHPAVTSSSILASASENHHMMGIYMADATSTVRGVYTHIIVHHHHHHHRPMYCRIAYSSPPLHSSST